MECEEITISPDHNPKAGEFDFSIIPNVITLLEKCARQSQSPETFTNAIRQLLCDSVHAIDLEFGDAEAGDRNE